MCRDGDDAEPETEEGPGAHVFWVDMQPAPPQTQEDDAAADALRAPTRQEKSNTRAAASEEIGCS